jgi:hypothetical protein
MKRRRSMESVADLECRCVCRCTSVLYGSRSELHEPVIEGKSIRTAAKRGTEAARQHLLRDSVTGRPHLYQLDLFSADKVRRSSLR